MWRSRRNGRKTRAGTRTARQIRRFIEESLIEVTYNGEDPLADEVLDSLAIEQLIVHLEERYRILFSDEEVVAENFSTISTLAAVVDAKRRAS